jgi:uncharacterized membrane protein
MGAWTEASTDDEATRVPPHVEQTVAAIAELHAAHYRQAGVQQKFVSAATAAVARPRTLGLVTIAIVGWLVLNIALMASGRAALDPFPFPLLSTAVSTVALYLAAMILIAQRHDDALATRRDQLTLELAILGEQKSAKIVALLEEFRRNDPNQGNHRDEIAEALAKPADPQAVLEAIKAAHGNAAAPKADGDKDKDG